MSLNTNSDEQLLKRLSENNSESQKAFTQLYNKYSAKVWGYCQFKSDTNEKAEELMQDTWLNFYKYATSGKPMSNILPMLLKIALNKSIDYHRSKSSKKNIQIKYLEENELDQIVDPISSDFEFESEEMSTIIKFGINYLDEIYKDVITLYWFGNLNYEEIADVLELNTACVRTRLSRAFGYLAKIVKPYIYDN